MKKNVKVFSAFAALSYFTAAAALLFAQITQTASPILYAESFRQGPTQITEQSFEAKLDPENPVYRQLIKDAHGKDRYLFSLVPQGPEGDNKITSWQAKLTDLHHPIYNNILPASQVPSTEPSNNLWRLEPRNFPPLPISAKRVIKVDSFYVTLEVKAFHFTPIDSPYLDSMTVQVKFTNTDPRPPNP
jgi:hypothetical protein